MGLKLFSRSRTLSLADIRTPDPSRTPTDFSDPGHQHAANLKAGYQVAGTSDKSTDGTLLIFQDGDKLCRAQNGILYRKDKTK